MKFSYASGDRPLSGYTIKRGVGIGGFGEVYFAVSDAGKEVALKRIQRHLEVELRGVSLCLNLKHVNLIDLYDIRYDDQGGAWVVMEYVTGESLKDVLDRNPHGLPVEDVLRWFTGLAQGVAYLHDQGLVHRDLKPGNVFSDQGTIKLGDYGLSKFIAHSQKSGHTESVGTFHYMAPEIGKGSYGKEIDIYALGVILFEMVTGSVPFDGESSHEIIMRHLTEDPPLEKLPERFRDVVERALHKDAALRFSSAQAMLEAVLATDDDVSIVQPPRAGAPVITATVVPSQDNNSPQLQKDVLYIGPETARPDMQFGPLRKKTPVAPVRSTLAQVKTPGANAARKQPPAHGELGFGGRCQQLGHWLESSWLATGLKISLVVCSLLLILSGEMWLLPIGLATALLFMLTVVASALRMGGEQSSYPQTTTGGIRFRSWQEMLRDQLRGKTAHDRVAELLQSWLAAAAIAALLGVVVLLIGDSLEFKVGSVALYAWLTLSTMLASWMILAVGKWCEGIESDAVRRRLVMLALGLLCGALVFFLHDALLLDLKIESDTSSYSSTMYRNGAPWLSLYMLLLAGVFALPRWWRQTDPLRRTRLNLTAVASCVLYSWLLHLVWPLPQPAATMLVAMISLVTQLSATWITLHCREKARQEFRRGPGG